MKSLCLILLFLMGTNSLYSEELVETTSIDDIRYLNIYENEGEQGLRPYIHAAADSVLAILERADIEGNTLGERNVERLLKLLRILSYAGDMSSKDALLKAMISPIVGGNTIARGLMRLDPQVKEEILSYLDNGNRNFTGTIDTLNRMARIDTTSAFITEDFREKIRNKLIVILAKREQNEIGITREAIRALAYFGDESVIPLLEELSKEDIPGLEPAIKAPGIPYIPNTPQEVIDYIREKK